MTDAVDRTGRAVAGNEMREWPGEGDLPFFPGCISEARLPRTVASSLELLRAAGARPYVPRGWACCGSPLVKIGDTQRVESVRKTNTAWSKNVERVVASCPGCVVELERGLGTRSLHILEFLDGRLSTASFDPRSPPVRVALHRPCHLARVVGPHTMDMARGLLSLVPGVTVVEHDAEDLCCGGGGGVAMSRPDVAERMAAQKVASARRAGADILLAPCPFCVTNLSRVGGIEVQELTTFVAGRLERRQ